MRTFKEFQPNSIRIRWAIRSGIEAATTATITAGALAVISAMSYPPLMLTPARVAIIVAMHLLVIQPALSALWRELRALE